MKIESSLAVPTAFLVRITDENGHTLRDLVYAREKSTPPRAPAPGPNPEFPIAHPAATLPFTLHCWTDDPMLAWYSGTATYETEFVLPEAPGKIVLDLGAVGVAAEVWINGAKAGERAWRPFRFDVTRFVHRGRNTLRVRVANSDANWQSQGGTLYPLGSWGLKYRTELDRLPAIRPNGLEGPVRLIGR